MCTPIISISNCSIFFLPSRIPNLIFNNTSINIFCFCSKFNTNSSLRFWIEYILGNSKKNICFTYTWITNYHDLE
jgi:hypothetical protein